jgi:hypothetical protein
MKKIFLVILTVSASFAFNTANAQWCGTVNTVTPNPSAPVGFPSPDSIPCASDGVYYNDTLAFQMYSNFNFLGQQTIDSVTIDTIWNLPCGLCWSLNKASKTYAAGQFGSLLITGTTHDGGGQYNLSMQVTAYINGDPTGEFIQNPNEVNAAGISIYIRVDSAGVCHPVDTASNYPNQTASTVCPTGINEVAANIPTMNVMPNPMNSSSAMLSFTAEKNAAYTMRITDLTGQVVSVKEIQAVPGTNTSVIERGRLSSGMYFISLTDGVSSVTRKFTVID